MKGSEVCCRSEWGIVLKWRCSSHACIFWRVLHACLSLLYYYEDVIIVLVESRCEASGLIWWAGISVCVTFISICHVCMITNGPSVIVLLNILVINGFVLLLVGDSWSRLRELWWFESVYWMLETLYWILQTLYWIHPPRSHPPNFHHSTAHPQEQHFLHQQNIPVPTTVHIEQHLRQPTGEHHSTSNHEQNSFTRQLIFQHWTRPKLEQHSPEKNSRDLTSLQTTLDPIRHQEQQSRQHSTTNNI